MANAYLSKSNVVQVHTDSGVWRATIGPDVATGRSATGKTPEQAIAALAIRFEQVPGHEFDPDFKFEPGTPPAAAPSAAAAPAAPSPATAPASPATGQSSPAPAK